ncbi:unnamed protein product [Blepharisma stoltei]|uniref:Uncharacterized protein n=1 Tax=Blepharisma stoltei TaxID=1481888 RepID=A0AAU9JAQ4_9CILI|nr:unnamed protein product [Blepharisma stoltei]
MIEELSSLFWWLGLIVFLYLSANFLRILLIYHILPTKLSTYGKSWALVTGATYGIGKAYAVSLAAKGFNLYLIARTESLLIDLSKELSSKYQIQVLYMKCDFSGLQTSESLQQKFIDLFQSYDFSILINNVSSLSRIHFSDMKLNEINYMHSLNTYPLLFLSKVFLDNSSHRKGKRGIITLSSASTVLTMPMISLYSGTKCFGDRFMLALYNETDADILCVRPLAVSSNMTENYKPNLVLDDPKDLVEPSLKCLGRIDICYGSWKHIFYYFLLYGLPSWLTKAIFYFFIYESVHRKIFPRSKM